MVGQRRACVLLCHGGSDKMLATIMTIGTDGLVLKMAGAPETDFGNCYLGVAVSRVVGLGEGWEPASELGDASGITGCMWEWTVGTPSRRRSVVMRDEDIPVSRPRPPSSWLPTSRRPSSWATWALHFGPSGRPRSWSSGTPNANAWVSNSSSSTWPRVGPRF